MRLTWITRLKASSGNGPSLPAVRAALPMPAQLTTIRGGPSVRASAASSAASTSSGLVTSPGENAARSPSSLATAVPFDLGRSMRTTDAPAPCSLRTVASPRPDAPPVTRATFPEICIEPPVVIVLMIDLSPRCRPAARAGGGEGLLPSLPVSAVPPGREVLEVRPEGGRQHAVQPVTEPLGIADDGAVDPAPQLEGRRGLAAPERPVDPHQHGTNLAPRCHVTGPG